MKNCRKCGVSSEEADFQKNSIFKDGVDTICKRCKSLYEKERYKKNRTAILNKQKKWFRKKDLKKKYGMTEEDYIKKFKKQKGRCAICGLVVAGNLNIDHDHSSGLVRGLLCTRCNLGLGMFKDDINILKKSIKYIKNWKIGGGD